MFVSSLAKAIFPLLLLCQPALSKTNVELRTELFQALLDSPRRNDTLMARGSPLPHLIFPPQIQNLDFPTAAVWQTLWQGRYEDKYPAKWGSAYPEHDACEVTMQLRAKWDMVTDTKPIDVPNAAHPLAVRRRQLSFQAPPFMSDRLVTKVAPACWFLDLLGFTETFRNCYATKMKPDWDFLFRKDPDNERTWIIDFEHYGDPNGDYLAMCQVRYFYHMWGKFTGCTYIDFHDEGDFRELY